MTSPNATPPASTPETPLAALQRENAALRAQLAAKPKASPRAKPRKAVAPKAKAVAAPVRPTATEDELASRAGKVLESLKAEGIEELSGIWARVKRRVLTVAEAGLDALDEPAKKKA